MYKSKRVVMGSIVFIVFFCVCFAGAFLQKAYAMPTPEMSEEDMLSNADIVAEGTLYEVTLKERWIGNTYSDMGYERGVFECSFLVDKSIKGKFKSGQILKYSVNAYMEGKWDTPQTDYSKFQYVNTTDAVKPGTKMRIYLKWDTTTNSYMRVHFNSGFVVLEKSKEEYPRIVGVPVSISTIIKGDSNSDGIVDSADYTLIRRYILEIIKEFPDPKGFIAADVNSDGVVDSADYTVLRKYLLGKITHLPFNNKDVPVLSLKTFPGKYTFAMSSTRGIKITPVFDGQADTVKYSADYGEFFTWKVVGGKMETFGQTAELPVDVPVYWSPLIDKKPSDDIITVKAAMFNNGDKVAENQFKIQHDDKEVYSVITSEGVTIDTAR